MVCLCTLVEAGLFFPEPCVHPAVHAAAADDMGFLYA